MHQKMSNVKRLKRGIPVSKLLMGAVKANDDDDGKIAHPRFMYICPGEHGNQNSCDRTCSFFNKPTIGYIKRFRCSCCPLPEEEVKKKLRWIERDDAENYTELLRARRTIYSPRK